MRCDSLKVWTREYSTWGVFCPKIGHLVSSKQGSGNWIHSSSLKPTWNRVNKLETSEQELIYSLITYSVYTLPFFASLNGQISLLLVLKWQYTWVTTKWMHYNQFLPSHINLLYWYTTSRSVLPVSCPVRLTTSLTGGEGTVIKWTSVKT